MTFREKLVRLRKIKGVTQDELAMVVGVSRQAVYKWESGQSYPEALKLVEIKNLLGISIDDLLDDSYEVVMPEKKKRRRRKANAEAQATEAQAAEAQATETAAPAPVAEPVKEEPKAEPAPVAEPVKEEPKAAPAPKAEPKAKPAPKKAKEEPKEEISKKDSLFARLFGKK